MWLIGIIILILIVVILYIKPQSNTYVDNTIRKYKLALIADNDKLSKQSNSIFKSNILQIELVSHKGHYKLRNLKKKINLETGHNYKESGAELSELINIDNILYTFCDKTGFMYKIEKNKNKYILNPYIFFSNGKKTDTPLKIEWCFKKGSKLIVGSQGIFVKKYNVNSRIIGILCLKTNKISYRNYNIYNKLRKFLNIPTEGYIIIETIIYDNISDFLYILPRKISMVSFNKKTDSKLGNNIMIRCKINDDLNCSNFEKIYIGKNSYDKEDETGFSSVKFIPNTSNKLIIALKTLEQYKKIETYIQIFDINGKVLLKSIKISKDNKYEGIEFIKDL